MKRKSSNPLPQPTAAAPGFKPRRPLLWLVFTLGAIPLTTTISAQQEIPALPHTYAARGCTQEDAPALEIYLTPGAYDGAADPTPPYLHLEISSSPTETLTNLTLELIPLRRDPNREPGRIARAEWVSTSHSSVFLTGTLTLDHATPGGQIQGHYQITTPGGQHLARSFHASYPTKPSVCG